jgi:hypothetical protein
LAWPENSDAMAAEISSLPAPITLVVEAVAAALASLSDQPTPATSAVAAANMSGAAITFDIVACDPSHRSISEKQKRVGLPARRFECDEVRGPRLAGFWLIFFHRCPMPKWRGGARKRRTIHKASAKEYAEGKRLWKNDDPVDRNLQGPE